MILLAAIVVIVVVLVVVLIAGSEGNRKEAEAAEGRAYIQKMESLDTAEIEQRIFDSQRANQIAKIKEELSENPDEVWKDLKELNTVFYGDSRVVGFSTYGYMDDSRVLAEGGLTLRNLEDYIDTILAINPHILVIAVGLNDINNTWYWENVDQYIDELNDWMEKLNEALPDSYIYINSILPATEAGLETSYSWSQIPEWNERIKANCAEYGWKYVDISDLADEYYYYYDEDGIHMMREFYPYWATAVLTEYLSDAGTGSASVLSADSESLDAYIAKIDSGEIDPWTELNKLDLSALGDSRVIYFSQYELLDSNHVFARSGDTIRAIPEYYEDLSVINPRMMIISYGINDLGQVYTDVEDPWWTAEEYIAEFEIYIDELKNRLPNTKIYVNSMIPTQEWTWEAEAPRWELAEEWNVSIEEMCHEKGIGYIDMTDITLAHQELYIDDGVHFEYGYYPLWGEEILKAAAKDGLLEL